MKPLPYKKMFWEAQRVCRTLQQTLALPNILHW